MNGRGEEPSPVGLHPAQFGAHAGNANPIQDRLAPGSRERLTLRGPVVAKLPAPYPSQYQHQGVCLSPYCHYRVLKLAEAGLREQIEKTENAPGRPFDYGRFDLILEPLDGGPADHVVRIPPPPRPAGGRVRAAEDRVPTTLPICRDCNQYVLPHERICPHCDSDIEKVNKAYEAAMVEVRAAATELERLLAERNSAPRGRSSAGESGS